MAFEKTPFSHCYIRIEHELGSWIYESTWPESHAVRFHRWFFWNHIVKEFEVEVPPHLKTKFVSATYSQLNKPYSFSQVISIAAWILTKKFLFKKLADNNSRKNICTELVGTSLTTLGVYFKKDLDLLKLRDVYKAVRLLTKESYYGNIS